MTPKVVAAGIDTWIINVHGKLPEGLDECLDELKRRAQELEEDLPTEWRFAGETLCIKPHGAGRQWRWILHCHSLHLDVGRGRLNHIVAKARLSAAYLWEQGPCEALAALYSFLASLFGEDFRLQVSEVHLCADIAGWDLTLDDANRFITRGHRRLPRIAGEATEGGQDEPFVLPESEAHLHGRRCTGFDFSRGAAHGCCIYDKTKEITTSRKGWMRAVWERNGWDGASRIVRVEFRYKRECLKELGVECPYEMLDLLAGMWAYSAAQWLRHTLPSDDTNRGRWPASPFWRAIQAADFFGDPTPLLRERKQQEDLTLICQMLAGCSTTAAAYLAGQVPDSDDGSLFLRWFYQWMGQYHHEKGVCFEGLRDGKRLQRGVAMRAHVA